MEKITVKKQSMVTVDVTAYKTSDGKVFEGAKYANAHEALLNEFPGMSGHDIKWLENFVHGDQFEYEDPLESFREAVKSGKVVLLVEHSAGEEPQMEVVIPKLIAVEAVIKVLHNKTVGCGCNRYVVGVVYRGESLCFDDGKKSEGEYYTTGSGKNIKEVLK